MLQPSIFSPSGQNGPVDFVVATYNEVPGVSNRVIVELFGLRFLFLTSIFNPTGRPEDKSPENVTEDDPDFSFLVYLCGLRMPRKILFFSGWNRSGGDRIIRLFAKQFAAHLPILEAHICSCSGSENIELAASLGLTPMQIVSFEDGFPRCIDWAQLYGHLIKWAYFAACPELLENALDDSHPKPSYKKKT